MKTKILAIGMVALIMLSGLFVLADAEGNDAAYPDPIDVPSKLYGVGLNGTGQQGDGTTTTVTTPKRISATIDNVIKVSTTYLFGASTQHTLFITDDGKLYGMGANYAGQLANADLSTNITTPTQIGSGLGNVVDILAVPGTSYFITEDGKLYGVGNNGSGQLGDGTQTSTSTPYQINDGLGDVVKVYWSNESTYFLTEDGDLYGCGYNAKRQITSTITDYIKSPTQIGSGLGVITAVACGGQNLYFITEDGNLYGIGYNSNGQHGHGDNTLVSTPTQIGSGLGTITDVSCTSGCLFFLTSNGVVYGCGENARGQLGDGTQTNTSTPIQIGSGLGTVSKIYSAGQNFYFITSSGSLYGTGYNQYYQIGNNSQANATTPTQIGSGLGTITDVSCTDRSLAFITSSHSLYCTGDYKLDANQSTPLRIGESFGDVFYVTTGTASTFFLATVVSDVSFSTVNATEYGGSISGSEITNVPYGSTITVSGNTVTINGSTITATVQDDTAQYDYGVTWSVEDGDIVTADMTITATFTRAVNNYAVTVTADPAGYGTVSEASFPSVPYGSTVAIGASSITINGDTITATPETDTLEYDYGFDGFYIGDTKLVGGETITGTTDIVAKFTRTSLFTVTIESNDSDKGTVSPTELTGVPDGTAISVSGNTVTIGAQTITATPASGFELSAWSVNDGDTVTEDLTITASFVSSATPEDTLMSMIPLIIIFAIIMLAASALMTFKGDSFDMIKLIIGLTICVIVTVTVLLPAAGIV